MLKNEVVYSTVRQNWQKWLMLWVHRKQHSWLH